MVRTTTEVEVIETQVSNMRAFELRSPELELVILPSLGGKMISFRDLATGRQWLWQDPLRPLREAAYGGAFASYDLSGFDECFPTIGECYYPEAPFKGVSVPDHGEVWSLAWDANPEVDGLSMTVHGVHFPYVFEKRLTLLAGGRCRIQYKVSNPSPVNFKCTWSAHPLFRVEPGMRVMLPGTPALSQELCLAGGRLQAGRFLAELQWPIVTGEAGHQFDLGELPFTQLPVVDKVVAGPLKAGWCAIWSGECGDYVGFAFDPMEVPLVGICVNLNPTPKSGPTALWVALEPCTGSTDRLDVSMVRGHYWLLPARSSVQWQLILATGTDMSFKGLAPDGHEL